MHPLDIILRRKRFLQRAKRELRNKFHPPIRYRRPIRNGARWVTAKTAPTASDRFSGGSNSIQAALVIWRAL